MPSLADELAGELDPNEEFIIPQNAGLGLSLADELDLEYHNPNANSPSGSHSPISDNQLLAPSSSDPYTHLLSGVKTPTQCMTKKGRASQTSTYYTANGSPGQLSALGSADEIDQSLYQLGGSDGSSSDREAVPDMSEEEDGEHRLYRGGRNDAGVPTPNMEEDMIAVIQDQVDDIARFVNSLKQVEPEKPVGTPSTSPAKSKPLSHSLNRSTRSSTAPAHETGAEASLNRYAETVDNANKASETNINDIKHIRTTLASISLSSEQASDLLATLDQPEHETAIAPTPTLASVRSIPNTEESPHDLSTQDLEPASSSMDPDESFVTANDPDTELEASPVVDAMHQIVSVNKSLVAELSQLSESVHLQQSFQTSTTRQIRGLKSTLLTWKEREEMEERAKVAIEQWERSQVERGLRGEKGTREVLDDLMMGFHRTLEDCERRMGAVRAKYAVTAA
jgi:hypothetical protein